MKQRIHNFKRSLGDFGGCHSSKAHKSSVLIVLKWTWWTNIKSQNIFKMLQIQKSMILSIKFTVLFTIIYSIDTKVGIKFLRHTQLIINFDKIVMKQYKFHFNGSISITANTLAKSLYNSWFMIQRNWLH